MPALPRPLPDWGPRPIPFPRTPATSSLSQPGRRPMPHRIIKTCAESKPFSPHLRPPPWSRVPSASPGFPQPPRLRSQAFGGQAAVRSPVPSVQNPAVCPPHPAGHHGVGGRLSALRPTVRTGVGAFARTRQHTVRRSSRLCPRLSPLTSSVSKSLRPVFRSHLPSSPIPTPLVRSPVPSWRPLCPQLSLVPTGMPCASPALGVCC